MSMKTVRVRVHEGRLEPLEALGLPEGAEVLMHFDLQAPAAGSPAAVLLAMRSLPDLDPTDIDDLDGVIEAGRLPVRSEGAFDRSRG